MSEERSSESGPLPDPRTWQLTGLRTLVVGGGGGLGSAMSRGLAAAGAQVIIAGRGDGAQRVAEEIEAEPAVVAIRADVTDRASADRLIDEVIERLGGIDILITAQGTVTARPVLEYNDEDWDTAIETNLTSVFRLARRAAADMLPRGRGKIITVSSLLSFSGGLNVPGYAAAKGGVAQVTKALANELAPHGVNVNSLAPGYIKTALNVHIWRDNPKRTAEILARLPAGRWGEPTDIVGPLLFLCSPWSDYLHGVILPVDGGWLSR